MWRIRQLSLERKISITKTLAISNIVQLSLVNKVPSSTITQLNKIQREFIWKNESPKIKYSTSFNDYENERLKNVDIFSKHHQPAVLLC